MNQQLLWIIAALGLVAIIGAFMIMRKAGGGFGPYNLRMATIALIATLSALLAISNNSVFTPAMTLFGVIVGYVFGKSGNSP